MFENNLVYPVHISYEKIKNCIDWLMITDKNESHCVYIKDFNRFIRQKIRIKNAFESIAYNVLLIK